MSCSKSSIQSDSRLHTCKSQTGGDTRVTTPRGLRLVSPNLTLADKNEEGANLLALQTSQQLGIQSLAIASQANQSVLRLFG